MERFGASVKPGDLSAGEVFGHRLAELRKARGWTQVQLADRITELGGVGIGAQNVHRGRVAKLESNPEKARRVTLEEVLAISYALGVSPMYMVVPLDRMEPRVAVMGNIQPADPEDVRLWLRGDQPLHGQDPFVFAVERPAEEIPAAMEREPTLIHKWKQSFRYPKEEKS
jgi:transcriptional regulator with XRE-family HTH domain